MNQDEIIEMARQAGGVADDKTIVMWHSELEAFAKLVAAKERERLVLEVEGLLTEPEDDWDGGYWNQAIERAVLKIEKGEA